MDLARQGALLRIAGCVLAAVCAGGTRPVLAGAPVPAETGPVLLSDTFDAPESRWRSLRLSGPGRAGRVRTEAGRLLITETESPEPGGISAAWHPTPITGQFLAEVEFGGDEACGLALVRESASEGSGGPDASASDVGRAKGARPDPSNFTGVFVSTDEAGRVVVEVRDRQDGRDDVLDNSGRMDRKRYRHVLDKLFSVPAAKTAGKLRIVRDAAAGFLHFYYAIAPTIRGERVEGWVELAPSREWGERDGRYFVALCARSGRAPAKASFKRVRVIRKPMRDRDDSRTGFHAVRREYNWSGFPGEALVVSFARGLGDRKFVFWSLANYVPAWHMDNQLLYSYEFVETWGGGAPGCHEPMSDRLLRWSNVEILEDNAARKRVRWRYVLCNPDYRVPDDAVGREIPEVEERWTFYPDGTGARHITYTPKLDSPHRSWHELTELIAIAGSLTDPREHLAPVPLTVTNLAGEVLRADYRRKESKIDRKRVNRWDQFIAVAHFINAPDAFCAFSQAADTPDTHSHYPFGFDVSWHGPGYRMCHWPVGLEPYRKPSKTHGTWKAQVSHTSLAGMGIWKGRDWKDHFKLDERGRKYREWVSLVGLVEPSDLETIRARTATWLYPGEVTARGAGCRFKRIDRARRCIVFECSRGKSCSFTLDPTPKSTTVVNPCFVIEGWGDRPVDVTMDNRRLVRGRDFESGVEKGAAVIWVEATFDAPTTFSVR